MNKKSGFIIAIAALVISTFALAKSFDFRHAGSVSGPFNESSINKFYDTNEGVICYIYAPNYMTYTVKYSTTFSNEKTSNLAYTGNNAGSISCVKK